MIVALFYAITISAIAQVGISIDGTNPDTTSMLDIKSTEKGMLIPRMSTVQFESIIHPANGLLVYCTDDQNIFVNRGSPFTPDWTMVNSKWRANGPNIYFTGNNVGIGWNSPIVKLDIRGSNPDEPTVMMIGNSDLSHRMIISGGRQTDPDPFIQWKQGDALRLGTDEGGGAERMRITSIGQVGIGTPLPDANLHVSETSNTCTGAFGTPVSTWNFGTNVSIGDDNNSSVLYIGQSTQDKGYIIWHRDELPADAYMSVGTYGDANPLILQEAGGNIGIGTLDPNWMLEIQYDANSYHAFNYSDYFREYIFSLEDPSAGDGQAALYVERYSSSGNSGTGYQYYAVNSAIKGDVYSDSPPDEYSFALAGYNPDDDDRCGGVIGSRTDGNVWGSLGYRSSASNYYGGYFTSYTSGTGKSTLAPDIGIGIGAWGDLMGADIHGGIYGIYTEGENYALFSNGTVYNSGVEVNLQDNGTETKTALYTSTSTDVTVMTSGTVLLSNGKASITFDPGFTASVSGDFPVIVTVTPSGNSNGVYTSEVTGSGFTVVENNNGKSNVTIHYIAIGRRAGYESPEISGEVLDVAYTGNMTRGLHNDVDTQANGEGLYYENGQLLVGMKASSNVANSEPHVRYSNDRQDNLPRAVSFKGYKSLTGKK